MQVCLHSVCTEASRLRLYEGGIGQQCCQGVQESLPDSRRQLPLLLDRLHQMSRHELYGIIVCLVPLSPVLLQVESGDVSMGFGRVDIVEKVVSI